MSCNNNTAPLVESSSNNINCNNGCSPKDINIVCRQIIIPYGQENIGVQGDNNSTTRTFILPDTTETGIDLKDKTFSILAENSNKQQWKTVVDKNDVEILDNYIKIKWNIGSNETAVNGILKISIEAVGDNFTWQTYSANFNVKQSLITSEGEIVPPLNLQEKTIIPSAEVQSVEPDAGYNGLSKVIVDKIDDKNNVLNYYNLESNMGDIRTYITKIPELNTSNLTNMSEMFQNCTKLTEIPLMDTEHVTNMYSMFSYCYSLKNIPLLDTKNVTNMSEMFKSSGIIEVPELDTSNVVNVGNMFSSSNIVTIPVLNFGNVKTMSHIFDKCSKLSNDSLNNILKICANAVNSSTRTLKGIGITSQQANICKTLSNYQEFLDAGWTTGY